MIKLYDYWRSSASYRVRIALNLLGLEFEAISIDLVSGGQRGDDYLARNPQGFVPAIEVDGQTFTQSLAFIEYLDETHGGPFLPKDPMGRARVRALSYAIAMDIHPICNLSVAKFATENSGGELDMKAWMHAFIPDRLAAFNTMLDNPQTGPFCHGNTVTMADICLVPQAYNADRWKIDIASMTPMNNILAELSSLEAVQKAHPENYKP